MQIKYTNKIIFTSLAVGYKVPVSLYNVIYTTSVHNNNYRNKFIVYIYTVTISKFNDKYTGINSELVMRAFIRYSAINYYTFLIAFTFTAANLPPTVISTSGSVSSSIANSITSSIYNSIYSSGYSSIPNTPRRFFVLPTSKIDNGKKEKKTPTNTIVIEIDNFNL